eukprot:jgi/Mesen1/8323/ME000457S07516
MAQQSNLAIPLQDRVMGSILGGACGDAMGAKVEFWSAETIFKNFGPLGIQKMPINYDVPGGFTDDTQMTLFTAEGLISAVRCWHESRGADSTFTADSAILALHQSYMRWLNTQGVNSSYPLYERVKAEGHLASIRCLHSRRAPGLTCTRSLMSGKAGTVTCPINDSKGCGGVMRVAPCGLLPHLAFPALSAGERSTLAFDLGVVAAALTHTHPAGYHSAGCLAAIICDIVSGETLDGAFSHSLELLEAQPDHGVTLRKLREVAPLVAEFSDTAVSLSAEEGQALATQHIHKLGGGWVGEEALAISLYCCMVSPNDARTAILYGVNHSGDSDSTGAIVGNILGAMFGEKAVPAEWRKEVELSEVLRELATDLVDYTKDDAPEGWPDKYPRVVM